MLRPYVDSGQLRVLYQHTPVAAEVKDSRIKRVTLQRGRERLEVTAAYFLEATDLGDLLPLCDTPFVTGAEAYMDTGEPHAPETANLNELQAMTYSFAVEYCPSESHIIPKPEGYERFRDAGLYTLTLDGDEKTGRRFQMFTSGEDTLPFWSYRRLLDASLLGVPRDVALINWASNDYFWRSPFDPDAHTEAKAQALGFLYWLQTEAPRDSGGVGYPELRLRKDIMDTPDGLSKAPYIREGRRIRAHRRILEQDISAACQGNARATPFDDTVGVGWYPIDLHRCVGNPDVALFEPTRPFQIPLGSLLPFYPGNLLAAGKTLGTTHLTNGAYRLHPVEWAVGEAAGALAASCLAEQCTPLETLQTRTLLRRFQLKLVQNGAPLGWTVDVPPEHPDFISAQLLVVAGGIEPGSTRAGRLELTLGAPLTEHERMALTLATESLRADLNIFADAPNLPTWADACRWLRQDIALNPPPLIQIC